MHGQQNIKMVRLSHVLCSGIVTTVCFHVGINNLLINEATRGAENPGQHVLINMTTGVFSF